MNDTLLHGLGYGAAYTGVGLALLVLGHYVLDLLTPGHLGTHLLGGRDVEAKSGSHTLREGSYSAGLVAGAWTIGQGLIIFTAIWRNATSGFGESLLNTAAFGLLGVVSLAVAYLVIDLLTPGHLGTTVTARGPIRPLAYVLAASLLAMAAIICASIA